MATILEERDALKLELNARRGGDSITIVNHTDGTTITCSKTEAYSHFNQKIDAGAGGHVGHVVDHKKVKEKKLAPGTQTRFTVDCGTNDLYRQVVAEFERVLAQVKNLTVARHLVAEELLASLKGLTPTKIAAKVFEGEGELPEWMK